MVNKSEEFVFRVATSVAIRISQELYFKMHSRTGCGQG